MNPKMCIHWQIIYENLMQELASNLVDVLDILNLTCDFKYQNSLCNFGYLMLIQTARIAKNNNLLN
jgi:hypothetical protein